MPPTVLLVDDEEDLLEIFAHWLERSGYRVLTAANGVEALKTLESETIDALVSDIRMPMMDGPTLVRRIRERQLAIPTLIFVSGYGDLDLREMHALGVEAMIEKPLSRETLLRAIKDSLTSRAELWLEPVPTQLGRALTIDLTSAQLARQSSQFELGRGGCCFPCDQLLVKGQMIDLNILFSDNTRCLKAQGEVRWYDRESALAGIAFRYLDPVCRDWVVDCIHAATPGSFIPSGRKSVGILTGVLSPA